jgi:predicted nucleic acid-binding protein
MTSSPKTVLVDTGFWYALYDSRDSHHAEAVEKEGILGAANVLIPWPCLYETFNTRFAKNTMAVRLFESFIRQPQVILFRDEQYRDAALNAAFQFSTVTKRAIALVDMVLRLIIEDVNVRKNGILTFNSRDFADLCRKFQIEVL